MSGKEEVKQAEEINVQSVKELKLDGGEVPVKELTEAQKKKMQKDQQAQARAGLVAYKKRTKESIDIKELQIREIEAEIKFFQVRKQWIDMQPDIEEFEQELAVLEAKEKQKLEELKKQEAKQVVHDGPPKIITPGGGKPRTEEEIKKAKEL